MKYELDICFKRYNISKNYKSELTDLRSSFVLILCIRKYLSRLTVATYGLVVLQATPVIPPVNPLYVFNTVPDFLRSMRFNLPVVEPAIMCL